MFVTAILIPQLISKELRVVGVYLILIPRLRGQNDVQRHP